LLTPYAENVTCFVHYDEHLCVIFVFDYSIFVFFHNHMQMSIWGSFRRKTSILHLESRKQHTKLLSILLPFFTNFLVCYLAKMIVLMTLF